MNMAAHQQDKSETPPASIGLRIISLVTLLLPVLLMLYGASRVEGEIQNLLWLGGVMEALGALLILLGRPDPRQLFGPPVIMLYVIALSLMLLAIEKPTDWFFHLARAFVLVIPLFFFAWQSLRDSGALALRQARTMADRLSRRLDWPPDLQACRLLPEVKAFREALQIDASPALNLLSHPSLQVRIAALAALEYRQTWFPDQPELLVQLAQTTVEPEIKIGVVQALANLEERSLLEPLAELMHDPVAQVRKATVEALLWNVEHRWSWLRIPVRHALGHPNGQHDGPLFVAGPLLPNEALTDLTAWANENSTLAIRAALTLGIHYSQALSHNHDPALIQELRGQLVDAQTPAILRLELARLLQQVRELNKETLRRLLDPSAPAAPLRLVAVEALLGQGESTEAVAALREVARLPNREIALSAADVIQRRLGVPMGLPRGQPLPAVQSRLAADVARTVLQWASQREGFEDSVDLHPIPTTRPRSLSEL